MKLCLGVVDVPYVGGRGQTTGDVAEILEAKYDVMGHFFEMRKAEIAEALTEGLAGALENVLLGAPISEDPFASGTQKIRTMFQTFLDTKQLDGVVAGVPTQASIEGRSQRFKKRRGKGRPSFVDTTLYENSFRAWMSFYA